MEEEVGPVSSSSSSSFYLDSDRRRMLLLTGASGCLGSFIHQLFTTRRLKGPLLKIDEVVALDIVLPRTWEEVPLPDKEHTGIKTRRCTIDIRNRHALRDLMEEIGSRTEAIIHTASFVSVGHEPDEAKMWAVNLEGTRNLLELAQEFQVPNFVYTSTADVMISDSITELDQATEVTLPPPKNRKFLIHPYALTKLEAEELVLAANSKLFRTLALRPVTLYGDGDRHFIFNSLIQAEASKDGILPRVGDGTAKYPAAYVGNIAWAHLCALETLMTDGDSELAAGKPYVVMDNTPHRNVYEFIQPFLEARGFKVSKTPTSFFKANCVLTLFYLLYRFLLRPLCGYTLGTTMPTPNELRYCCTSMTLSDENARLVFGYKPIFSHEEASKRSMEYYKNVRF